MNTENSTRVDLMGSLLDRLPSGIFWKDKASVYLGCNKLFARYVNLSSLTDVIGKTDYDLHTVTEEAGAYRADDEEVIKKKIEKFNIEETQTLKNGEKITLLTNKVPLLDHEGEVIGVLGIYNDITELKNTQKELLIAKQQAEAANQAKSDFLRSMQHDIRTPLTTIMLLMHMLKNKEMDKETRESFTLLEQVCTQFSNLCRHFSEVALNENGEEPVIWQEVNIRAIAYEITLIHEPMAQRKNIAFKLQITDAVRDTIISDTFRLKRILLNLLGNAIKFTDEGAIHLNIYMSENSLRQSVICLEVIDTGIGIAKDHLPYIFNKYVRDIHLDTQKYPGTGLGLYYVRNFVKALGGEINVESVVGQGTRIRVLLPLLNNLINNSPLERLAR